VSLSELRRGWFRARWPRSALDARRADQHQCRIMAVQRCPEPGGARTVRRTKSYLLRTSSFLDTPDGRPAATRCSARSRLVAEVLSRTEKIKGTRRTRGRKKRTIEVHEEWRERSGCRKRGWVVAAEKACGAIIDEARPPRFDRGHLRRRTVHLPTPSQTRCIPRQIAARWCVE